MSGRPGRSGRRKARVLPMPPVLAPWQPTADDLEPLGAAGRRFLTQMLAEFDPSVVEGVLLIQAAQCLDGVATWRPASATDKQSARLVLGYTKTLAALLAQLRVSA
jgi:hypothetical protein